MNFIVLFGSNFVFLNRFSFQGFSLREQMLQEIGF